MASFPSLTIQKDAFIPQGSFAQAQATYLSPDTQHIEEIDTLLQKHNIGIVAHYYMDVELQGILSSCSWPHIRISDSLLMADTAVEMAEEGVEHIIVLGVDFMSENVRAVLDAASHENIPVYRVDQREIGCSLAQAAEAMASGTYPGGPFAPTAPRPAKNDNKRCTHALLRTLAPLAPESRVQ